jgi:TRAP-type C4-dicarboxylate transport system substrate-binding protein
MKRCSAVRCSWGGFSPYKLHEVTTYHVEAPLGQATSMFFMSRRRYDALPADVRRVIGENSGEATTSVYGDYFLKQGLTSRAQLVGTTRHTIVGLNPDQSAKWEAKAQPLVKQWAKDRPDGEAVLEAYRQIYTSLTPK